MEFKVETEGFERQQLTVKSAGAFSGPKLLLNGSPAPKGEKRGEFLLTRDDGKQVTAKFGANFLDHVPHVIVDGQKINLVEPLHWYQWVWAALPILLVFLGGVIGGAVGAVALAINVRLFRSEMKPLPQYLVTGAVSGASVIIYIIVAILIQSLL